MQNYYRRKQNFAIRLKQSSPGSGNFNRFNRSRRPVKKLDANLFINKARVAGTQEEFQPKNSFSDYQISDKLKANIVTHGYTSPTPVQDEAIPYILEGRDLIGVANTGTGKTAAFLIPLIEKVSKNPEEHVLIVTPTRELAMQILDEFNAFSKDLGMFATLCIGGANIKRQEVNLRRNPNFVIGTPGRLIDLIRRDRLSLTNCNNVVLDEVDRMVDIGFIKDIKYLVALLPKVRHSLFFSATVSGKVRTILDQFVHDPITVSVKVQETAENIEQEVVRISDRSQKLDILHNLLIQDGFDKVLVFGGTKRGVEKLYKSLEERGFKVASIHGNKSQGQRARALEEFKTNQLQILLATDVASRGLDIENVTHVINYDAPHSYDDYVHRIGRTGRADKSGAAITFVE
ncbi:MAG: DEAD/DEAH box helicase [Candidatus Curtissbacteria bacterium]